ncbi:hypothetical protein [Deinococcus pimensis]|uniref:hypothetical protein n=1 Tax=Deinococcus pimensis TaxID=309888 RepID=UPI0004816E3F|nr:hypothetical protein [Deinococcus pimensis]
MTILLALLSIPAALYYWKFRPSDPAPLFFSLAWLFWLLGRSNQDRYDASAVGMSSSILIILFTLRNHGRKPQQ